jgi:hypothetical protein
MTEMEMENGSVNQIENTQEGVDAVITNLNRNSPESMNTFDNIKEMIMPDVNELEMGDDIEYGQGYIKMELSEMQLARKMRDETKGDRLIEGEARYDPLEKYEEADEEAVETPDIQKLGNMKYIGKKY